MSKSEEAKAIKGLETDVKYYARQYMRDGLSLEDLQQEGFLGALHGIRKWDESRGASLRTYASIWINLYVKRAAQGNPEDVSMESMHDVLPSSTRTPEDIYEEREPLENLLKLLTPQQLEVIRCRYVEGGTCVDAAQATGMSKSGVNRAETEALRKMRAS